MQFRNRVTGDAADERCLTRGKWTIERVCSFSRSSLLATSWDRTSCCFLPLGTVRLKEQALTSIRSSCFPFRLSFVFLFFSSSALRHQHRIITIQHPSRYPLSASQLHRRRSPNVQNVFDHQGPRRHGDTVRYAHLLSSPFSITVNIRAGFSMAAPHHVQDNGLE